MPAQPADRNLLFGFLALQLNFIPREELIAAVSVWLTDKSRSLDEIFRQRGSLADDERELLAALVRKHLQKHHNNPEKSLAALSSVGELRDDLKKLGDADVEASLLHVAAKKPARPTDPDATVSVDPPTVEKTRFRILRPHAEGGLGQVFVAKDLELNREVALKEIKSNRSDDQESRSRFVLEAEITGGLEHPGIVPVYGLGQYADGRPFYAMRFIRGDSLKEAIERFHKAGRSGPEQLGLRADTNATTGSSSSAHRAPSFDSVEFRQLLGRFIDVCNAIEYAHSRGVLHRDLKPGNIMLGKYGETLVVDWGLAKAKKRGEQYQQSDEHSLQLRSGSGSAATQVGSAIGTPAYMSPEQAAGRLDQLGPATDVYSLGATLFSLLTGELAFSDGSTANILRDVQTGNFPRPREKCPTIPQPLQAICLKAMALRPIDRYATPQSLADDIDRYLADETVRAHAEPFTLRTRRWLRKHPRSVTAVAAALLIGVTSSILISSVVADRNRRLAAVNVDLLVANRAERQAKIEADDKRSEAELARQRAESAESIALANERIANAERHRAEQETRRAEQEAMRAEQEKQVAQAVKDFLQNRLLAQASPGRQAADLLHESGTSTIENANPTIRELLDRAAAQLAPDKVETQFPRLPLVQAELLRTIGFTYSGIGEHQQAAVHLERSRDIYNANVGPHHADTLDTLLNLALAYLGKGREEEAISMFKHVLDKQIETLGHDHYSTLWTLGHMARAYSRLGRTSDAISVWEQIRDSNLKSLGPDHPDTLESQAATFRARAEAWKAKGELDKAISDYNEALRLGPKSADTYASRGAVWHAKKEFEKAIADFDEALRLSPNYHWAVHKRADVWSDSGETENALTDYTRALELDPKCSIAYNGRGLIWRRMGLYEKAIADYSQAIQLAPKRTAPYRNRASASINNGDYSSALADYSELVRIDATDPWTFNNLAWLRATCPDKCFRNGAQAVADATKACEMTNWNNASYVDTLAAAYAEVGDFATAIEWQEKAIAIGLPGRDDKLQSHLDLYKAGKPYRQSPPSSATAQNSAPATSEPLTPN